MGNLGYCLIWLPKKIVFVCCKINMIMLSVCKGICHFCPANIFKPAGPFEKKKKNIKVEVSKMGNSHSFYIPMNITTKKRKILLLPPERKAEAPLYSVLKLTSVFSEQRVNMGERNYKNSNLRKCFN